MSSKLRAKPRTETIIIPVLVVNIGGPVLSSTVGLEDGFLAAGYIATDTLESGLSDTGVKGQTPAAE